MVEKYCTKFQAYSKLFDHATHNSSHYLKEHCFVSIMLHVPLLSDDRIVYLTIPLGYRLWAKELPFSHRPKETGVTYYMERRNVMKRPYCLCQCDSFRSRKSFLGSACSYAQRNQGGIAAQPEK